MKMYVLYLFMGAKCGRKNEKNGSRVPLSALILHAIARPDIILH